MRIPGGAWALALGTRRGVAARAALGEPTPVDAARIARRGRDASASTSPVPVVGDLIAGLTHPLLRQYLVPVILPMGLFNVLGSLQNIESAEAAGDSLPDHAVAGGQRHRLGRRGVLRLVLPDHDLHRPPGLEGARRALRLLDPERRVLRRRRARSGSPTLINALVPMEAGMAIVLWIGIVITAQAFQATPPRARAGGRDRPVPGDRRLGRAGPDADARRRRRSRPATPALAARVLADAGAFAMAGLHLAGPGRALAGLHADLHGVVGDRARHLIDRAFRAAARCGCSIGAVLAFFGFVHAGTLEPGRRHLRHRLGDRLALGGRLRAVRRVLRAHGAWVRSGQSERPQDDPLSGHG